jgi:hypothetical protein
VGAKANDPLGRNNRADQTTTVAVQKTLRQRLEKLPDPQYGQSRGGRSKAPLLSKPRKLDLW